jgi:hypothetical protein
MTWVSLQCLPCVILDLQAPESTDCLQIDVTTGNGDPFRITDGPQHVSVYEAVSHITANVSRQLQAVLAKDPKKDMCVVIFIGRPIVLLNHRRQVYNQWVLC